MRKHLVSSEKINPKSFSSMTKNELLAYCRKLYVKNGIQSLTYPSLKKDIYWPLYWKGINQKSLIRILGVSKEYEAHTRDNRIYGPYKRKAWTWEKVLDQVSKIVEQFGFLPPAAWFQKNGHGGLCQAVYNLNKSWDDLRLHYKSYQNSTFVQSRNGMRWLSHPEASLSNFLFARGIEHKKGHRYPLEYAKFSGLKYGYFDMHFMDKKDRWIDVEIWGDKPKGHAALHYAKKRFLKERFNSQNIKFLGIGYSDCYDEKRLAKILQPYIGKIKPFIFKKAHDRLIQTTHWSNADELIECCREFAKQQPDGRFPTEEWLRKRGKWKNRSGEAYNTMSIYIKTWIGGIRKLREIIGQEQNSTRMWDRLSAIKAYKEWYAQYGKTPEAMRYLFRYKKSDVSHAVAKKAANLSHAIKVYVGGAHKVNRLLGI